MFEWRRVLAVLAATALAGTAWTHPIAVEEATVADLQAAMVAGRTSARALTAASLERIARLDAAGPKLRAVIEVNPEARAIAEQLDRERKAKGPRGPLHGIPVLIKDNIDTADRMETTAGSLALVGAKPQRDAFVVERLRAAGAVILGKTNLSEWANIRSSKSTSGWSARGGQTRNPYALDRNPSGSSSGSAVAVAASLAPLAVGTETDGSIISPASICGVVGIKPTVGLVSRAGIIPIAHSQDTAGPMARSVADAAQLLWALAGADERDAESNRGVGKLPADPALLLRADALRGARIGVVRAKAFGFGAKPQAVLDIALERMRQAGAEVVDVELPNLGQTDDDELAVLLYELKADLANYLASRPDLPVRTLADVVAWNQKQAKRELPYFGQELFELALTKGSLDDPAYRDARARNLRMTRSDGIDAVMNEQRLDALVSLSNGPAHLTDLVNGDAFTGYSSTPAAIAGYPAITVPAGFVHDLPIGVSFYGKAWSEPRLIELAYSFEQVSKARRPPRYLPTLELP